MVSPVDIDAKVAPHGYGIAAVGAARLQSSSSWYLTPGAGRTSAEIKAWQTCWRLRSDYYGPHRGRDYNPLAVEYVVAPTAHRWPRAAWRMEPSWSLQHMISREHCLSCTGVSNPSGEFPTADRPVPTNVVPYWFRPGKTIEGLASTAGRPCSEINFPSGRTEFKEALPNSQVPAAGKTSTGCKWCTPVYHLFISGIRDWRVLKLQIQVPPSSRLT